MTRNYDLVYQSGLANVFRITKQESEGASFHYARILQGDYRTCEAFCAGLLEAGELVSVWHSDVCGDVNGWQAPAWQAGKGDLWSEHKHPPVDAEYSQLVS